MSRQLSLNESRYFPFFICRISFLFFSLFFQSESEQVKNQTHLSKEPPALNCEEKGTHPKPQKRKRNPKRRRDRTPTQRDPKPLTLLEPSIFTGVAASTLLQIAAKFLKIGEHYTADDSRYRVKSGASRRLHRSNSGGKRFSGSGVRSSSPRE